ncbi:hypothetical protein FEDK69T_24090 [Flavobacterium enshiense DK69]|nr:hypothetical protein FEDK69T_24090 [Flavobacterium enshiense DK69]
MNRFFCLNDNCSESEANGLGVFGFHVPAVRCNLLIFCSINFKNRKKLKGFSLPSGLFQGSFCFSVKFVIL